MVPPKSTNLLELYRIGIVCTRKAKKKHIGKIDDVKTGRSCVAANAFEDTKGDPGFSTSLWVGCPVWKL